MISRIHVSKQNLSFSARVLTFIFTGAWSALALAIIASHEQLTILWDSTWHLVLHTGLNINEAAK